MEQEILLGDTGVTVLDVLNLVAKGNTYDQILKIHPSLTQTEIMTAARFSADFLKRYLVTDRLIRIEGTVTITARSGRILNLTEIRKKFPRAFETWNAKEESTLKTLFEQGTPFNEIAEQLQRNVGAVISRLKRLKLVK